MSSKLIHREISEVEWFTRMKKIESSMMTPWVRVANNVMYSLQWIGKEVLYRPERRYFGLLSEKRIICCVGMYYLSPTVIRARGFYCEPQYRQKGYMKECFLSTLRDYSGAAEKVLVFSPQTIAEFYKKLGFQPVSEWTPRPLEYFDHRKGQYVETESIMILERPI